MTTRRVLIWIYNNYGTRIFKRVIIGKAMEVKNIGGFIQNLQKWGCIRYVNRTRRGWAGYVLTEWGKKCAVRWGKEG